MTVNEMHIEVSQSTQLVAANRTRKWYPEEIDWVLNKMMYRFIENSLIPRKDGSGGFELDQSKVDGIRMLVKTNIPLTPYIDSDYRYKTYLPANYLHLLSDASYTRPICSGDTNTTSSETLYLSRIRQNRSTLGSPNYYQDLELVMTSGTVNIPDNLPYNHQYTGYPEKSDISFLVPFILWKTGVRWERFGEYYYPGYYLDISKTDPGFPSLEVDGVDVADYAVSSFTLTKYSEDSKDVHRSNRLTPSHLVSNMLSTAHFKPSFISPISELERDILWIHANKSFIVSRVEVSMIRKPQPISLSLGTDCELGETAHQKICDLAVEYLQGRTKDTKGVELTENDISKRIIL